MWYDSGADLEHRDFFFVLRRRTPSDARGKGVGHNGNSKGHITDIGKGEERLYVVQIDAREELE